LPNKEGISFWVWDSIATPLSERLNSQISSMSGSILLYFFILLFYLTPILFLLFITSEKNKFCVTYIILSIIPFIFLFFIGIDWGRWIHIIIIVAFSCLIQFKEKKLIIYESCKCKIFTWTFIMFILFQFIFTRIPHCCNLAKLNLNIFGGIISKIDVFYSIINNNYDIQKRFQKY